MSVCSGGLLPAPEHEYPEHPLAAMPAGPRGSCRPPVQRDCGTCSLRASACPGGLGRCGSKKKVQSLRQEEVSHFVWLHKHAADDSAELRLSMDSVLRYVNPAAKITVIGDRPGWYTGHHLPSAKPTMKDIPARMPFRDTQAKIMQAARSPEISERFVWMMDDQFFLRPTAAAEIDRHWFDPWFRMGVKCWHNLIRLTFSFLKQQGKSNLQTATHLPHVFEKQLLEQMFALYGFPQRLLLFEVCYQNHWRSPESAVAYSGFLRRIPECPSREQLEQFSEHVLNYYAAGWTPVMRSFLEQRIRG